MDSPLAIIADANGDSCDPLVAPGLPIPRYLEHVYWWANVHPRGGHLFEREWLVNLVLFGGLYQKVVLIR